MTYIVYDMNHLFQKKIWGSFIGNALDDWTYSKILWAKLVRD
jgi:hypothetical protein